jgi:putative transposase
MEQKAEHPETHSTYTHISRGLSPYSGDFLHVLIYTYFMPQKNTIKQYASNSYYHVYTRGVNKQKIFMDQSDYEYFLQLLDRYLGSRTDIVAKMGGAQYPNYRKAIRVESYCLMGNHFHFLLFVGDDPAALPKFMSSLKTAYGMFYNLKYKRVGALFESRYKAKLIEDDRYLAHIHRYIHLNPRGWRTYKYSSLKHFYSKDAPIWFEPGLVEQNFSSRDGYIEYISGYEQNKAELEYLKTILADQ